MDPRPPSRFSLSLFGALRLLTVFAAGAGAAQPPSSGPIPADPHMPPMVSLCVMALMVIWHVLEACHVSDKHQKAVSATYTTGLADGQAHAQAQQKLASKVAEWDDGQPLGSGLTIPRSALEQTSLQAQVQSAERGVYAGPNASKLVGDV